MIIQNGCVTLRAIEERDTELLLRMINSPELEWAMGSFSMPVSEAQQREWIRNYRDTEKQLRFMIEPENGITIGTIMLYDIDMKNGTAEVGYKIMAEKEKRIRGDMDDAMQGVLSYAFLELRLHCVTARTLTDNLPSEKLLLRNGFTEEGILRQRVFQRGGYRDMKMFSVLECEFKKRRENV